MSDDSSRAPVERKPVTKADLMKVLTTLAGGRKSRGSGFTFRPKYRDRKTGELRQVSGYWIGYMVYDAALECRRQRKENAHTTDEAEALRLLARRVAQHQRGGPLEVFVPAAYVYTYWGHKCWCPAHVRLQRCCLYVGRSKDWVARLGQHRRNKEDRKWFPEIVSTEHRPFKTERQAIRYESERTLELRPKYNRVVQLISEIEEETG
jgi:hypothetical protein